MDQLPVPPLPPWPTWPARRLLLFIMLVLAGDYLAQLLVYGVSRDLFLPVLAGSLLGVVLPCRLLARGGGSTLRRDFHLDRADTGTLVAAVVVAAASLLPTSVLAGLSARIAPVDPQWVAFTIEHLPSSGLGIVVAAVTAVLAAPLAEELLFRGLIYRLTRRTWGPWPAAVVSSLLFGLIHGEPWYLFGLVGLGLVLTFLYETTGSLLAPVIAHALHNAVSLFLMIRNPAEISEDPVLETTDWILLAVSVTTLAVAALLLSRRKRRFGAA
jgi:membrane protease YdiL (CAAX protease family)